MSTRERLVEAMSASMRQRGYGSTAMKEVLAVADATAGSMYHHFPEGKAQLASTAVSEVGRSTAQDLAATIEEALNVADAAVTFYQALIADMESSDFRYGCPIGVPTTEMAFVLDDVREAGAEVFASWVDSMSRGLQEEGWAESEAKSAAQFAVSAYEGASTLARATRDSSYISDTLEFVRQVLSGN